MRWAHGRRAISFTFAMGVLVFVLPANAQTPLLPQLSYCIARYPECSLPSSTWPCTQLKSKNSGPGFANDASERYIQVGLAYLTASPNEDPQQSIDATDRVEICKARANSSVICPGGDWVILDRPANKGIPKASSIFTNITDAKVNVVVSLPPVSKAGQTPYTWDDPAEEQHLILRVNGLAFPSKPAYFAALAYGACANWRTLASSTHFDVVGVGPTVNPFDPSFDVCKDGAKMEGPERTRRLFEREPGWLRGAGDGT